MPPTGLIEALKQVPDFRSQPRYPSWVILLLVVLGTMKGAIGYRALEAFGVPDNQADDDQRHQDFVSTVSVYSPRQGVVGGLHL